MLHIESRLFEEFPSLMESEHYLDREIDLPPGELVIRFSTDAERQKPGYDMKRRPVVYRVYQVRCDTILSLDEEEADCWDIAILSARSAAPNGRMGFDSPRRNSNL